MKKAVQKVIPVVWNFLTDNEKASCSQKDSDGQFRLKALLGLFAYTVQWLEANQGDAVIDWARRDGASITPRIRDYINEIIGQDEDHICQDGDRAVANALKEDGIDTFIRAILKRWVNKCILMKQDDEKEGTELDATVAAELLELYDITASELEGVIETSELTSHLLLGLFAFLS